MKERWPRAEPSLTLDAEGAARLLRPLYPDARVVEVTALDGGLINSNLRVRLAGLDAPLLLRLYQRQPAQGRKEAEIARRLAGSVPAARFLHFADDNPITGHAYGVLEWIEGERLDRLAGSLDDGTLMRLGQAIGEALARIHSIRFARFGFFEDGLAVPQAIDLDCRGLLAYLRACLIEGPGGKRLGEELAERLVRHVERHGTVVDRWLPQPCLVHGDFNPANLLVRPDPDGTRWELAAVLDWEFALSGTPPFDFGNLLRPPLGRHDGFCAAVAEGYRAAGGTLPEDWRRIARLVDLAAWADLLSRPRCSAPVVDDARAIIGALLDEVPSTPPPAWAGHRSPPG